MFVGNLSKDTTLEELKTLANTVLDGTNKKLCISFNKDMKLPEGASLMRCLHVHAARAYLAATGRSAEELFVQTIIGGLVFAMLYLAVLTLLNDWYARRHDGEELPGHLRPPAPARRRARGTRRPNSAHTRARTHAR